MRSLREQGWTTGETVIAMLVFGILVFFTFIPALRLVPSRYLSFLAIHESPMRYTLSNMRQLQLVTQAMAEDGITNGNTNMGWPGDTGGSFSHWATMLVQENYLSTNDLCKMLSGPGRVIPSHQIPTANTNATLVYAVGRDTAENTVFLSTANFTNSPAGGSKLLANAKPFGDKAFAVLRKDGEGNIVLGKQVGQTNLIGGYVPLCE